MSAADAAGDADAYNSARRATVPDAKKVQQALDQLNAARAGDG